MLLNGTPTPRSKVFLNGAGETPESARGEELDG